MFNVYLHINPLKNQVFYVGMGNRARPFDKNQRNRIWKSTIKKYGYIVDVIETGLTKEQAIQLEKFYIKKIGRRNLGLGSLINLTDGGEGTCNKVYSEEYRLKLTLAKIGKTPWNKGVKYNEAQKKNIGGAKWMGNKNASGRKGIKESEVVRAKKSVATTKMWKDRKNAL